MSVKKSYNEVKLEFENRGYTLLSKEYINNKSKLDVKCNNGHMFKIRYDSFRCGGKCRDCKAIKIKNISGRKRKYTIDEIKKYLEFFNYELLTDEYKNTKQKLLMVCPENHQVEISFNHFNNSNRRCKYCAIERNSKTLSEKYRFDIEQVRKKFAERGYILLSDQYINAFQKLNYVCDRNHSTQITLSNLTLGRGCKICADNKQKMNIKDVKLILKKRGYELISDYKNNRKKIKLKCPYNHIIEMQFFNFRKGHGCKVCAIENRFGSGNHRYNSELTSSDRENRRLSPENNVWRDAIFKRDNYTCRNCKSTGIILNAHHIYNYSEFKKYRFRLFNGVTLCYNCHIAFHNKYGRNFNNLKQLKGYLNENNNNY